MQWVILIGDKNLTLDSIKAIKHYGSLRSYDVPEIGERFCVDYGDDHIFYDYEEGEDAVKDFDEEDLRKIPFDNPHTITMVYQSEDRMKSILRQDNFLKGIYIDDDHGHLLPIEKFNKL
jgi:hypothetical protein